jgi:hypothetical protein
MSTKVHIQMAFDPEQLAGLRRVRDRTGCPVTEQVRRAVDAWLKRDALDDVNLVMDVDRQTHGRAYPWRGPERKKGKRSATPKRKK